MVGCGDAHGSIKQNWEFVRLSCRFSRIIHIAIVDRTDAVYDYIYSWGIRYIHV